MEGPFQVLKYTDTDDNGFFDRIEFDMNGDTVFEMSISLKELGLDDRCEIIDFSAMEYDDLVNLKTKVADNMWQNAEAAMEVAVRSGIDVNWYAMLMHPKSVRQKYHMGYWLQYYLFMDLIDMAGMQGDAEQIKAIKKAYFSGDWKILL